MRPLFITLCYLNGLFLGPNNIVSNAINIQILNKTYIIYEGANT